MTKWLGLDIGGANLKAATSDGEIFSTPFRFWVEHQRLTEALAEIIDARPACQIAATMTAELADCFESRQQGVHYVVDCLQVACQKLGRPDPVFAATDLKFRSGMQAKRQWLKTAASNWAMLAAFAKRFLPQSTGLVVDMGSTTTDLIPVCDGEIATLGQTDSQRMRHGELVYVGADRTALSSLPGSLQAGSRRFEVARELFSTVGDAMLLGGFAAEDPANCDTADGRPRTIRHAAQRLCRAVCEDLETIGIDAANEFAAQVLHKIDDLLRDALAQVQARTNFENIVVTGSGGGYIEARRDVLLPEKKVRSLSSHLGIPVDQAAPAYAVAVLASEGAGR